MKLVSVWGKATKTTVEEAASLLWEIKWFFGLGSRMLLRSTTEVSKIVMVNKVNARPNTPDSVMELIVT